MGSLAVARRGAAPAPATARSRLRHLVACMLAAGLLTAGALLPAAADPAAGAEARARQWQQTLTSIAEEFPDVPRIATGELAAMLARDPTAVLLLDARTGTEYRVSHLPGAVLAGGTRRALARVRSSDAQTVVVYCSVGYRSARLAQRLRRQGVTNVANLEGSLFKWFNEGRPVVREGQPAHRVHPYNDAWERLLDPPPD